MTEAARAVSLELDSPELAATYDAVSTRQFDHGKLLIADLALKPGERVLDIGCGTGRLGAYVADQVAPNGNVVGIDPLPLRIDLASKKSARFQASVGRAEDLSAFANDSFDAAYANSVFHWVQDKPRALKEALRVLRGGGRFGVNSADGDRAHESAALVRAAVLAEGLNDEAAASGFGTNFRVNGAELEGLLLEAGFADVRVVARTFVDELAGVDDLLSWSKSSSFGNFLSGVTANDLARLKSRLTADLEARRRNGKIQLERYLVFAVARKPS